MPLISPEEINRIKDSNDIVDTISKYIPLVPKGKNFFGVCPFHEDHSPSMSVSKEKQIYTCFSCGATGNVIKFIEDYENVSFMEALKILADRAGIVLSLGAVQKKRNEKNGPLYEIYDLSSKFYHNNINTALGKAAKEYLKQRNIDETIIKEFGIGLALKKHDMLIGLLINKKFDMNVLMKSGLVVRNEHGYLDSYYNRIMFPLWDITGKVVGFSGRIYSGEKDAPKYINSKESEIFKKGELLYNYHRAKEEARKENTVIVMEGFMDVIRAYTIGLKNVIAMMGTAVTKEQALLIKRMAKDVILCFDGDSAGEKATLSCSEELLKLGVTPKIIHLEDNLDPDEYISKFGAEKFLRKLENPINVMDFKLSYLKKRKNLSSEQDVAKYVSDVLEELTKIDDDILKELTLRKISEESKLDIEFLKKQLASKEVPKKIQEEKVISKKKLDKYDKAQMYLLYYMLRSKEVIRLYNKKITFMPNEQYRNLAFHISYYYKLYGKINVSSLIDQFEDNKELIRTLGQIEQLNLKEDYSVEEINDYLNTIKEYNVRNGQAELQKRLKEEQDLKEKVRIANEILALKVRREENDK
ncbi:MAG: DNA primase [Bacilli bacterium]|nr:DNA primase [Bacilli bacterium]